MKKIVFLLFMFVFLYADSNKKLEEISIQLIWKYQFEFAGLIAAIEKGFYEEEGLNVILKEYKPNINVVDEVLIGRTDLGLNNSLLIMKNSKLLPVVVINSYFQRSPLIFITQKNIKTPKDFIGKTIMGSKSDLNNSSLNLFLEHFFITKENTTFIDHQLNIDKFINKDVDIMAVYSSNELFELDKLGYEYNIFDPVNYGFIATADNLFASKEYALKNQDIINRFTSATKKGWDYAFKHKQELIDIIYDRYSKDKSKDALMFEANESEKLFQREFNDIGSVPKELYYRLLKQLKYMKKIDENENLKEYFFDDFLKRKNQELTLSNEEKQYLREKKEITLCIDPDWLPFEALKNGKHIGISADIFDIFRSKINVPIKLIPTQSWQQSLDYAKNRTCDLFSLASSNIERERYMDFTSSYIDLPIVIATKNDEMFIDNIEDIKSKKIGIVKGYSINALLKSKYPDINIIDVKDIHEGLEKVENGEIYCYIDNLLTIARNIQINYTHQLKISGRLDEKVALGVGTRNDEPLLNSIFQKLVNGIEEKQKQQIYNKWISVTESVGIDYKIIMEISVIIFLLLIMFIFHYLQLRKYNKKLYKISITDKLTTLFNRTKIDELLEDHLLISKTENMKSSIVITDIDFFKSINDKYGHIVGDDILKEFSSLLKIHTRKTDFVGRWGGEEFLLILPNTNIEEAKNLANNLREIIQKHNFTNNIKITSSFGVGQIDKNLTIVENVKQVDNALYLAKKQGRNRVINIF